MSIRIIRREIRVIDHLTSIGEGNLPNHSKVHILGFNDDVDNVMETIWPVGGEYVFPTGGMGMEVVSSATADDDGDTGVNTVKICYLDTSYVEQTEIVTLNGQGVVATSATDILRINDFHTASAGSGGKAAGNIDLRHLADTPIYARIAIGHNGHNSAVRTVPAGKSLHLTGWGVGVGHNLGNRFGHFVLQGTTDDDDTLLAGIFSEKDIVNIQDGGLWRPFEMTLTFPSQADVKASVVSDAANSNAITSASIEGWLE